MLGAAVVLAACSSSDPSPTTDSAAVGFGGSLTLSPMWELGNVPITRSVFKRRDVVVLAGELERDAPASEAITAIDAATGELRWTHRLRSAEGDPQAVAFAGDTLRIVAADEGIYVSSYGGGAIENPIVGFAVGTGLRLFPSDDKLESSRTSEEVIGAVRSALVTSVGILRDPATGLVRRLKFVDGVVLAIAGGLAFAWDGTAGELTGYDLTTDQPRWTIPMPDRPTVVVQADDSVMLARPSDWVRLDLDDGTLTDLDFAGVVDPLNSFDTCATASFQSVPVGRYSSLISCDSRHVAASLGDRVEVLDLETGTTAQIAVCDPEADPFAVSDGIYACATRTSSGGLGIRLIDASTGFLLLEFDDRRAAPVGLVLSGDQLIVSLEDGTVVSYRITR